MATTSVSGEGGRRSRHANWALALAGFSCFSLLYGTQPVLPQLTHDFHIAPAQAALAVSAGTAAMACLLIPWSLVSDRHGRVGQMGLCLLGAAVFAVACGVAPDFFSLILMRIGLGACVAGVPAAAMAYLGEELAPEQRAAAMGFYIGANALGGMSGRVAAAVVTEYAGWRWGLASLGVLGLASAAVFWRLIPPSRQFKAQALHWRPLLADVRQAYADPGLPRLFWVAFLIMGSFVGLYNFLGFRLSQAPYYLGPAAIGAIFLLYLMGSVSSVWAGRATARFHRHHLIYAMGACMVAGILLTLADGLLPIVLGLALFTFGYFAVHTIASAWVGRRAGPRRGLVSALYLSSYYLGSSVIGTAVGWPWQHYRWPGVTVALLLPVLAVLGLVRGLGRLGD